MGNSGQKMQDSRTISIINHQRFRANQVRDDISHSISQFMRTSLPVEHDGAYFEWEQNLNRLSDILDDQNFLLPKGYEFVRDKLCGSSGVLKVDYDNYPYILQDEIVNRAPLYRFFEEEEVWYLLYVLVASSQQFCRFEKKLGDIRPANIFINDTGQVKTSCLYSWPSQKSNYQKTLMKKQVTYLSPEQAVQIRASYSKPSSNSQLSQSFSIGISILHVGLLQSMNNLYNFENNARSVFNEELLKKYLNQWINLNFYSNEQDKRITYSDPLKFTVLGMCEVDPKIRLSSRSVYEWLRPHEVDIVNLHTFTVGMPPYKPPRHNVVRQKLHHRQIPSETRMNKIQLENKIGKQSSLINANTFKRTAQQNHRICGYDPVPYYPPGTVIERNVSENQNTSRKHQAIVSSMTKPYPPNITQCQTPNSNYHIHFPSHDQVIQTSRHHIQHCVQSLPKQPNYKIEPRGNTIVFNSSSFKPTEQSGRSLGKTYFQHSNPYSDRYTGKFITAQQVNSFMASEVNSPLAKTQRQPTFKNIVFHNQNQIRNSQINFASPPKPQLRPVQETRLKPVKVAQFYQHRMTESLKNQNKYYWDVFKKIDSKTLNYQKSKERSVGKIPIQHGTKQLSVSFQDNKDAKEEERRSSFQLNQMLKKIDAQVLKSQSQFPSAPNRQAVI